MFCGNIMVAVIYMRVVSGTFKGRQLRTLGGDHTRPTTGKVREAVFSSLGVVSGAVWLDLFAGSGAMGIEALSRGARYCFFADNSKRACEIIQQNLAGLGIGKDKAWLYCADTEKACALIISENREAVDIAYLDPPYGHEALYARVISCIQPMLAPVGLIIIEHQRGWLPTVQWGEHLKTKFYGLSAVSFFRKGRS